GVGRSLMQTFPELPASHAAVYSYSVNPPKVARSRRERRRLAKRRMVRCGSLTASGTYFLRSPLVFRLLAFALIVPTLALKIHAQEAAQENAKPEASIASPAAPISQIKALKDFRVELLYSVPKREQGSWVNMCVGPNGTLIVSDQGPDRGAPLYRIYPPALGADRATIKIEKIPVDIGEAQGLLWAFDSLYVVTNGRKYPVALYRVRDTNGDGELDKVEE